MAKQYEPLAIANYFIKRGIAERRHLTQMQIHKLVYFAHAWALGIYREPLLTQSVEAWKYGPVVRSLYHTLKIYGARPISRPVEDLTWNEQMEAPDVDPTDDRTIRLLDRIWDVYGHLSAVALSQISHERGGPWDNTFKTADGEHSAIIPESAMTDFFGAKARNNAQRRANT